MSTEPPTGAPQRKTRLPFDERPFTRPGQRGAIWIYGVLTFVLLALAAYMAVRVGHPLMSPYVAGPAVGALWFGLRLFMNLGPRS